MRKIPPTSQTLNKPSREGEKKKRYLPSSPSRRKLPSWHFPWASFRQKTLVGNHRASSRRSVPESATLHLTSGRSAARHSRSLQNARPSFWESSSTASSPLPSPQHKTRSRASTMPPLPPSPAAAAAFVTSPVHKPIAHSFSGHFFSVIRASMCSVGQGVALFFFFFQWQTGLDGA